MDVLHRCVPPSEMRQHGCFERARRIPVRCPTQLAGFSSLSAGREKRQERKRLQECKEFFASVAVGNPFSFVPVLASDAGSGRRYLKKEGLRLHVAARTRLQRGHMIELYTAATPNGWRTSIALEESGLNYAVRPITLTNGERKEERAGSCQPVVPSLDPLESPNAARAARVDSYPLW